MIDASDPQFLDWLAKLSPRQELIVRIAMRGRAKNLGRHWDARIEALETELKINTTAKETKLMRDVRAADAVIDAWARGDDPS